MATIAQRRRMYQNMTVAEILRIMSDAELDRNARRGGKGAIQKQAYRRSGATTLPFSKVSRENIEKAIERLPAVLEAYCAELKRRHQRYADLRRKAEQIKAVLEG